MHLKCLCAGWGRTKVIVPGRKDVAECGLLSSPNYSCLRKDGYKQISETLEVSTKGMAAIMGRKKGGGKVYPLYPATYLDFTSSLTDPLLHHCSAGVCEGILHRKSPVFTFYPDWL